MSEPATLVSGAAPARLRRLEHVMGMPVGVDVCDARVRSSDLDRVYDWLRFVDRTFSTYRSDSEISLLNRGELSLDRAHPAVRQVLERCERLREQTHGFFDISAPPPQGVMPITPYDGSPVDPSGLVKGWAIAGAGRLLRQAGARNYSINAGGDALMHGHPDDARCWRVGIQHPRLGDQVAAVVGLRDGAVATSGAYERGEHIIDPHTGRPPKGVQSVTVVGPDIATADVLATSAYAMGPEGAQWCAGLAHYAAMVILDDDTVLFTPGFHRYRL